MYVIYFLKAIKFFFERIFYSVNSFPLYGPVGVNNVNVVDIFTSSSEMAQFISFFYVPPTMYPQSYLERNQNLGTYSQRLWWCITTSSSEMVDFTEQLVDMDSFYPEPANIIAYEVKGAVSKEKYVTIIKRFHKPVSRLQVYDDWICKVYTTKRHGQDIFRIWHPSQSEISRRTINDDLADDFVGQRNKLWTFTDGIFSSYRDCDGDALQLR